MVPPDTSMVCGVEKALTLTWLRIVLININISLVDFVYLLHADTGQNSLFLADWLNNWQMSP